MINIVGINKKLKDIIKVLETLDISYLVYCDKPCNIACSIIGNYDEILKSIDNNNKTIVLTADKRVLSHLDSSNIINLADNIVIVRGAGDLASAVIIRLFKAGYKVLALEIEKPTLIRTNVAFATCMYSNSVVVDGVKAKKVTSLDSIYDCFNNAEVPVLVDENLSILNDIKPLVIVDAIIAKRNLGLKVGMAPLTIALGPGFVCAQDADFVIETQRGHDLGRILTTGEASKNTGIPGVIKGHGQDRVVKSLFEGVFKAKNKIGDVVTLGDTIAFVDNNEVKATMSGQLRGMLSSGLVVTKGFKVADIDPRINEFNIDNPSDKAFSIAGSVLQIIDNYLIKVNSTL